MEQAEECPRDNFNTGENSQEVTVSGDGLLKDHVSHCSHIPGVSPSF